MTNITTASVIVSVERFAKDKTSRAVEKACDMFMTMNGHKSFYSTAEAVDNDEKAVVPFDSAAGEERITEKLEKTKGVRADNLETLLELVEEAKSVEAAASDQDLCLPSRQLGVAHEPQAAYLYDEAYYTGDPVLNRERLDEIAEYFEDRDEVLYVVDVELKY